MIFNVYYSQVVAGGVEGTQVNILGWRPTVPGTALWNFLVSISTAIVAITSPFLGALADKAGLRKLLLVIYCYIGVLFTIGLKLVGSDAVWLGAVIFIIANLGFAGGNVFYNAFLLDIGRRETFGRLSGAAWGVGYLGGGLCLAVNLVMLKFPGLLGLPEGYFDVGDCMVVAGLWWGIFALPTMLWLHEPRRKRQSIKLFRLAQGAFGELRNTFKQIKRFRQLWKFLLAYLIFNDGIETVIVTASIFGAEVIGMDTGQLVVYFLMVQGTALVGAFLFGWLADRLGNKRTLLITLVVWTLVVIWAFKLGWLTDMVTEYYILGVVAGLVLGGSQSAARALQASFTPPEHSAQFFGFYAVSGRFANVFGTLILGAAILLTGGLQPAILTIGIFFIVGGALVISVDETKGVEAVGQDDSVTASNK